MIAQRVIYYFRDLLDIKATRAAAAWLRLNNDGTVSERTAAQTLVDLGAASVTGAVFTGGVTFNSGNLTMLDETDTTSIQLNSALGSVSSFSVYTGNLFATNDITIPDPNDTAFVTYPPVIRMDAETGAIVAKSLTLTTTPLPITSGGTGGDTPGAARTKLELGSTDNVGFRTVNVSGTAPPSTPSSGIGNTAAAHFAIYHNSTVRMIVISTGTTIGNAMGYAWSSLADPTNATRDLILVRDDANTLAQRNGTNAQKLRVYGTTTGSKYVQLEHDGTNAKLSATSGNIHISGIPTSNPGPGILWNDAGTLKIGT